MTPLGPHLLKGVRVVSLEQYISGPYCTQILVDAGAEVIKVERPDGGDPRRGYDPKVGEEGNELSGGFASYNRGKKSITLDLRDPAEVSRLREVLATADVFVANLRPGALGRLGLDVPQLRQYFPRLIICEITGFGVTGGPYGNWPAFDSVIQAMSGFSSLIGEAPESPPGLAPMSTMDQLTGIWAALGILAGLTGRATTGEGCHVDAAMYDVGAALIERPLTLHEFTGEAATRGGDSFSPVGAFQAADSGWISIVIPTDEMWVRCCEAMGREDLIAHPELDSVVARAERMQTHVLPALTEWAVTEGLGQAATVKRLRDAGQPAGAVQTIAEVRDCEQLRHRRMFTPLDDARATHPDGSALALPRTPVIFDGEPAHPGPVPRLGEHNNEVLGAAEQPTVR